jgi:hypothetical protein
MPSTINPTPSRFTVQTPFFAQAPLARQLHGLAEIGLIHAARHLDLLVDLIIAGQIVPLSPLDQVVVIDDAATALQIEVVTGEAHGVQGWVPKPWLHPFAAETPHTHRPLHPAVAA